MLYIPIFFRETDINLSLDLSSGIYRVVGVASKVTKCLSAGLDKKKSEKLNFEDPMEWESKTITSAAKTFLRNLPEPLMTFRMHSSFIAAASKLIFSFQTPRYTQTSI